MEGPVQGRGDSGELIPVLICIDVEPDARFIRPRHAIPWRGYEHSVETFRRFRAKASEISGAPAHFTWVYRMDPQVVLGYGSASWVVGHYDRETSGLAEAGDDLGLHPHAYRWSDQEQRWRLPLDDQEWVDECLNVSAAAFESSLGRPCRTVRFGDRWMSQASIELLQRLGARYDLTLEPWHLAVRVGGESNAVLPDYSGVPEAPYRPSRADYRVADPVREDGLVIIPMTTAAVRPRFLRDLYDIAAHRGRRSTRWTALLSHDPVLFRRIITKALQRRGAPHLALPVRSGALAEPRLAARVTDNLNWMLSHPLRESFRWSTADETLQRSAPSAIVESF
ncbi:MAG TPA: hypothetical protein VF701_05505 [Thermoanaerobaculia bacterium]